MSHPLPSVSPFPPIAVATVVAAEGEHVGVHSPAFGSLRATLATQPAARPGERVLVAIDAAGAAFVIARLDAPPSEPAERRLVLEEGDLELVAARGRLLLRARDGVHVESEAGVEIEAAERVVLTSAEGRSRLTLDRDHAEVRAGLFEAKAARLRLVAEELEALAARADVEVERLRERFEVVETDAERIVERAKNVYREVEDLAQTQAGRLRFVARESLHTLAERAHLTARKLFRIDGDRIHLG